MMNHWMDSGVPNFQTNPIEDSLKEKKVQFSVLKTQTLNNVIAVIRVDVFWYILIDVIRLWFMRFGWAASIPTWYLLPDLLAKNPKCWESSWIPIVLFPNAPWCWNIYLHLPKKCPNVCKYSIHGASGVYGGLIWSRILMHIPRMGFDNPQWVG